MKRRLTIARSLINEPEILLLDEPTTGLDPQARHVVWDRLFRLKQQGVTLVLTTHYMDEAEQLCDRLVVMDGGQIAAEGSPRELIEPVLHPRGAGAAVRPGRARAGGREAGRRAAPSGSRCWPTGSCSTSPTGTPALAAVRGLRPGAADLAGAPQHAGGRLPAADRPAAGGLMAASPPPDRRRPPPAGRRPWAMAVAARSGTGWSTTAGPGAARSTPACSTRSCTWAPWAWAWARWSTQHGTASLGGVSYLAFLAPGLLAAAAHADRGRRVDLPGAGAVKWQQTYQAAAATPLRPADLLPATCCSPPCGWP